MVDNSLQFFYWSNGSISFMSSILPYFPQLFEAPVLCAVEKFGDYLRDEFASMTM